MNEEDLQSLLLRILGERTPADTEALLLDLQQEVEGHPLAEWVVTWVVGWISMRGPAEAQGYTWTAQDCDDWIEETHGECNSTVVKVSAFGTVRAYATDTGLVGWQEFPGVPCDRWALMTKKQVKEVTKSNALSSLAESECPF